MQRGRTPDLVHFVPRLCVTARSQHLHVHAPLTSCTLPASSLSLPTANFSVPVVGAEFKEVIFAEESGAGAIKVVEQQRAAGRAWLDWHKKRGLEQGQEQQGANQVRGMIGVSGITCQGRAARTAG